MKPNLVFMFADQLRLCSTGYGGDKKAKTQCPKTLPIFAMPFRGIRCARLSALRCLRGNILQVQVW